MKNDVNVGQFDTLVDVLQVTQTIGTQGQKTTSVALYSQVWAKVERSIKESISDYNLEAGHDLTVTMYKIAALTTRWRLRIAGKSYEISGIDLMDRMSPFCTVSLSAIDG